MEPNQTQPPDTPLAALIQRLQQLAGMNLPTDAHALIQAALTDAAALGAAPAPVAADPQIVDHDTFDRLMDLAGPTVAPELLAQLARDLATVDRLLGPALASGDRAAVGAQTHTLLALAGSVGATPLYLAAKRLNRATHDPHAPLTDGAGVIAGLTDLRQFIDHRLTPDQTGPQ